MTASVLDNANCEEDYLKDVPYGISTAAMDSSTTCYIAGEIGRASRGISVLKRPKNGGHHGIVKVPCRVLTDVTFRNSNSSV